MDSVVSFLIKYNKKMKKGGKDITIKVSRNIRENPLFSGSVLVKPSLDFFNVNLEVTIVFILLLGIIWLLVLPG